MSALLHVKDLCLRRGARDILRGVTFEVPAGDVVALMGLSGSGKTTILRSVAALEAFSAGEIAVGDAGIKAGPHHEQRAAVAALRRQVGMVFQFHHLFEHLPARENVILAPVHVHGRSREAAATHAQELLDDLGVGERALALPRELSGGEAQRVAIARALAIDPPLLLLDEPTASLDPARRGDLAATLRRLASSGRALLLTSHDVDFVQDVATRCVILAEGKVVEDGAPQTVLNSPSHDATRALLRTEKGRGQRAEGRGKSEG